jgi:hypothetical protein
MTNPSDPIQPEPQPEGSGPGSPPPGGGAYVPPVPPPGSVPPPGVGGPPPDPSGSPASFTVSVPPQVSETAQKGLDTFSRDPGSWCTVAVLLGVGLIVLADLVLAADRFSLLGYRTTSGAFRARFLVFTGFASFDIAVGLLLAAGLALAVRTPSPAPFRKPVLLVAALTSVAVAGFAALRAIALLSFGHSYGFGGFIGALGAIPVALVAAAFGFVAVRSSAS